MGASGNESPHAPPSGPHESVGNTRAHTDARLHTDGLWLSMPSGVVGNNTTLLAVLAATSTSLLVIIVLVVIVRNRRATRATDPAPGPRTLLYVE